MLPTNKLTTEQIAARIKQFYAPAEISDYDDMVSFSDFRNLFAAVEMPATNDLLNAIKLIGFSDNSKIDDMFLVQRIVITH